ncbi:DUF2971 domain-containing protein [Shewanella japonica]|uniref:DUF2971 domain-containing protein n=1 Tax=Shewanella japonica TaxID=93973 RepID=UPI0024957B80|nr:DUF2971 domain-containing protein [Shewanella japonica]
MMLYKYVSFNSAIIMLNKLSLGFTGLEDLNDPFECTNFGFSNAGSITPANAVRIFKQHFSRKYAVSSLTRNPLNSLMWSHYGDSHRGVVVGIDADECGLTLDKEFIIPAQLGEIIYVGTKNKNLNGVPSEKHLNELRSTMTFNPEIRNYLKQAFLYKSLEWGYEEEVRVIKSLSDFKFSYHDTDDKLLTKDGKWNIVRNKYLGQPLFCYKIPQSGIKEIYLGANVYRNAARIEEGKNKQAVEDNIEFIKSFGCNVFKCEPDVSTWDLMPVEL